MHYKDIAGTETYCPLDEGVKEKTSAAKSKSMVSRGAFAVKKYKRGFRRYQPVVRAFRHLKRAQVEAMRDELEKLGAGPDIIHVPGMQQAGLSGSFLSRRKMRRFYKQDPGRMAKELGMTELPKKDVVFLSKEKEIRKVLGKSVRGKSTPAAVIRERAKEIYRSTRAHELTHWLRAKRGKFKRMGKPGVRGVLSTGREELAAHVRALKRLPPALKAELAVSVPSGVMFSTRHAYPGKSLRKALMGGQAGKLIRRVLRRR